MDWFTPEEVRANCFLIVNQAFRWGMDPFAVMPETYVVGGKLGYQGKLIAGLVNSLADLEERLSYEFKGTKGTPDFTVIVSGKFRGAKAPVTVEVSVGQAQTDNQMWKKDPEQKLVYTGATKWARRWCPEIILGILTDDDLDSMPMRDATPAPAIFGNPYSNDPKLPEPAKKPPTRRAAAKDQPQAEAAAEEPAAAAPVETPPAVEAEAIPSRKDMYNALKVACGDAEVSPATAEAKFRKAGLIPDGKTLAETTDDELFVIYQARLEILPPKTKN